jgi:hypothetical protein
LPAATARVFAEEEEDEEKDSCKPSEEEKPVASFPYSGEGWANARPVDDE